MLQIFAVMIFLRIFRWSMCSLGLICFSAMTLILFKYSTQKRNIAFFLSLILLLYNRPNTMKMGNAGENPDHKKAFVQEW